MSQSIVDLILHPIRMRILMALAGRQASAGQLAKTLPDVPQATLYRHLKSLAEGGVVRVVAENPVRGTLEKIYALDETAANIAPEEITKLSKDEHMSLFVGFIAGMLDDYARYLENQTQVNLITDGVGYRKVILQLNNDELANMARDLNQAIKPYLENKPSSDRRTRIFSTILMPDVKSED